MNKRIYPLALLALAFGSLIPSGCAQPGPDPQIEESRVEAATRARELFVQTSGDFSKLTETERQEFLQIFDNNEQNAQFAWEAMRMGGTGGATTTPPTR